MTPAGEPGVGSGGERFVSLDVMRGVAVMGILLANLPGFALPEAAYFSPLAAGPPSLADRAAWLANFILVEGRMRGLFSFLFGASLLLVVDRARAAGENDTAVHLRRMAILFLFGMAHLYLVWWGDILSHYAIVGTAAYLFSRLGTRLLLAFGAGMLALSFLFGLGGHGALVASAARDTPAAIATWDSFAASFGTPQPARLAAEIAAMQGPWSDQFAWRLAHATNPFAFVLVIGPQTLAAMLFGMAAFRSGMLTGGWDRARLRRWAIVGLALSLPAYALLGVRTIDSGFDQRFVYFGSIVASEPFRVIGVAGYAALVLLLVRPGGWLTTRLAAVGRTAFTNYLGSSILMTAIFYGWGLGLFATLPRAAIYAFAPLAWGVMLLWSKTWLDRFAFGPFEWAWRSLARGRAQPLRRVAAARG